MKTDTATNPLMMPWEVAGTLGSDNGPYFIFCPNEDRPVIIAKDLAHPVAYHIVRRHNEALNV